MKWEVALISIYLLLWTVVDCCDAWMFKSRDRILCFKKRQVAKI